MSLLGNSNAGKIKIIDHNGRIFPNMRVMLEHYKVTHKMFEQRLKAGWGLEKALTTPMKKPKFNKTT